MSDYLHTKVFFPVSLSVLNSIMKEYPDANVRDDSLFMVSRGDRIGGFLSYISHEYHEDLNIEYTCSSDWYNTIYVGKFDNGVYTEIEEMECLQLLIDDGIYIVRPDDPVLSLPEAERNKELIREMEEIERMASKATKLENYIKDEDLPF